MVTLECRKCGARQQAAAEEVIAGVVCRNCRARLRVDDGSAVSVYQIDEAPGGGECLFCGKPLPPEQLSRGALRRCPACGGFSLTLAPDNDFPRQKSSWSDQELTDCFENAWRKMAEKEMEIPLSHAGRLLAVMHIKSNDDIGARLHPLLQTVIGAAERRLAAIYHNFRLLTPDVRLALCRCLASTSLLEAFFYGEDLEEADVAAHVKNFLRDERLYERLSKPCSQHHFMLVSTYVREFVLLTFKTRVSRETLEHLTLAAMAYGLEEPISSCGYFIYVPESDSVQPAAGKTVSDRQEFYLRDNEINRRLHRICVRWGIRRTSRSLRIILLVLLFLAGLFILVAALRQLAGLE